MTNDTVLILTSTVNVFKVHSLFQKNREERLKTYVTALKKWIEETNFKIIIVDNSGYDYPEFKNSESFLKLSYTYTTIDLPNDQLFLQRCSEKGQHEMFSICYAFNHIPTHWQYKNILKITGRYFVHNFEKHIESIPKEKKYFAQKQPLMCEIFGGRKEHIHNLFILPSKHDSCRILEKLNKGRFAKLDNVHRFPNLKIDPVVKGSRNTIMRVL